MIRRVAFFCLSLFFVAAAGCQTAVDRSDGADASIAAIDRAPYTLGSGDRLRVIVFGEPELSGEFVVDNTGLISMPLVGEVPAAGATVRGFQTELQSRLEDGYLRQPRVSAEVINFRPYYILGEVNRAGEYPYTSDLTILNAVATAEGFTYRANRRVVYVRGADEEDEVAVRLTPDTPVRPGDTIRVAERLF